MKRFVVVTGTDTGVGKTVVTTCLAAAWCASGRRVAALKAVASGVPNGEVAEDARLIARAAGHEPRCFASFVEPLSPHLAAERAGQPVDPALLEAWIREHAADLTLVEGSGGWEVPLSATFRVSHLAATLGADVVLVARNRLGVLNHALLTVAAIRAAGLSVVGIALSPPDVQDLATELNERELRRLMPDVAVSAVPPLNVAHAADCTLAGQAMIRAFAMDDLEGTRHP